MQWKPDGFDKWMDWYYRMFLGSCDRSTHKKDWKRPLGMTDESYETAIYFRNNIFASEKVIKELKLKSEDVDYIITDDKQILDWCYLILENYSKGMISIGDEIKNKKDIIDYKRHLRMYLDSSHVLHYMFFILDELFTEIDLDRIEKYLPFNYETEKTVRVMHPIGNEGEFKTNLNYCYKCGTHVRDQKYCHQCGYKLIWRDNEK